jgi:malate dehydrogenase (oxaloacetate-decarboxylating)(NADP+)
MQDMPASKSLEEVVKKVKPTALIGAAAQPKTFTKEIIEEMSRNNERPVCDSVLYVIFEIFSVAISKVVGLVNLCKFAKSGQFSRSLTR